MDNKVYIKPGKVFGNIYFVGTHPASTHIIDTGCGLIMIDPGMPEYFDIVTENIKELGFDVKDIKIILLSHGHYDHAGAVSDFLEICDAKTYVGKDDENMVTGKENTSWSFLFGVEKMKPFTPDVLLCDGDTVELGNTKILCLSTPGHTDGTMSFFFDVTDGKDTFLAGMHGGAGINTLSREYLEKENRTIQARDEYLEGIDKALSMNVEIFLGNHVYNNKTDEKLERVAKGEKFAFVAPCEWRDFLTDRKKMLSDMIKEGK